MGLLEKIIASAAFLIGLYVVANNADSINNTITALATTTRQGFSALQGE